MDWTCWEISITCCSCGLLLHAIFSIALTSYTRQRLLKCWCTLLHTYIRTSRQIWLFNCQTTAWTLCKKSNVWVNMQQMNSIVICKLDRFTWTVLFLVVPWKLSTIVTATCKPLHAWAVAVGKMKSPIMAQSRIKGKRVV